MLNWIGLYFTNMVLTNVKDASNAYTYALKAKAKDAILPTLGLEEFFSAEINTWASRSRLPSFLRSWCGWIDKTKFGYELKATGYNKNAAKYCGTGGKTQYYRFTSHQRGALAGLAGAFLYQTDIEQSKVTISSVPTMGFNGIAAEFLGGLNPNRGNILLLLYPAHYRREEHTWILTIYCSRIFGN